MKKLLLATKKSNLMINTVLRGGDTSCIQLTLALKTVIEGMDCIRLEYLLTHCLI